MPSDPINVLYGKMPVASEIRSAEWDIVPVWLRERAFFMATVDRHKTLAAFRDKVGGILAGNVSPEEARRDLREILERQGYRPTPGTEGSMKDLRSVQRMKVTLETNVRMCQGYAQRQRQLASVAFPGQRLVRIRQSRVPRDWSERWNAAAGAVGWEGVSRTVEFVALLRSPIWRALSRFGTDYPPFDFGSGMGVAAVGWDETAAAGLIPDDEAADALVDAAENHHLEALNKDLEAQFTSSDRILMDDLSEALEGFATWDGDVLKFTDPNGSRPISWQDAGDVIGARLPDGFEAPQKEAVAEWVKNSGQFQPDADGDYGVGLNMRESAWRAFERILPTDDQESGTLYRGMTVDSQDDLEKMIKGWRDGGYSPRAGKVADSWTTSAATAKRYSMQNQSNWRVVLVADEYHSGKRIDKLVRTLQAQGDLEQPNPAHPHVTEGETLFLQGTRFTVNRVEKKYDKEKGVAYVYVRENS